VASNNARIMRREMGGMSSNCKIKKELCYIKPWHRAGLAGVILASVQHRTVNVRPPSSRTYRSGRTISVLGGHWGPGHPDRPQTGVNAARPDAAGRDRRAEGDAVGDESHMMGSSVVRTRCCSGSARIWTGAELASRKRGEVGKRTPLTESGFETGVRHWNSAIRNWSGTQSATH